MWFRLCGNGLYLVTFTAILSCSTWAVADDMDSPDRLSLADLVAYRAALTGKPTAEDARASDPAVWAVFKDLWNRPKSFRGRRVIVEGRVQRIFRQGPVGDFPALAEIWIASPVGDPFCLVVPQETVTASGFLNKNSVSGRTGAKQLPEPGLMVRFTGTFLRMVGYSAGDRSRRAPLIIGDQPPVSVQDGATVEEPKSFAASNLRSDRVMWSGSWLLGLLVAMLLAAALALCRSRLAFRQMERRNQHRRAIVSLGADPPLEFVEPLENP
jgi:hypothetical protein